MRTPDDLRARMAAIGVQRGEWDKEFPPSPWVVTLDGREWAIDTDGRVLVGVGREYIGGELASAPAKATSLCEQWLPKWPPPTLTVAAGALKAFAHVAVQPKTCETCHSKGVVTCEDCEGEGYHECECTECGDRHEMQCATCKGDGESRCDDCSPEDYEYPVSVAGVVINRARLRDALAAILPLARVAVDVAVAGHNGGQVLLLRSTDSPQWFAVVMSMRNVVAKATFKATAVA